MLANGWCLMQPEHQMHKILLAGCGVMGEALRYSWLNAGLPFDITIIDPSESQYFAGVDYLAAGYLPDIVIFAVKPKTVYSILPDYFKFCGRRCLFISVAAGIALETYHAALGAQEVIIRAMPNIAVTAGQGMTALVTQAALTRKQRQLAQAVFEASGQVAWLEEERLMDVVTAVSGSGPAYFFSLVESLAKAGAEEGLPADLALRLARQTAVGAGALLQGLPAEVADLRRRVTSPGGTTEAALAIFAREDAFQGLIRSAVQAAIRRARELSQGLHKELSE